MTGFNFSSATARTPQFGQICLYTPSHPSVKGGKTPAQYSVNVSNYVLNDTPGRIYLNNQVIAEEHPGLMKLERALTQLGQACSKKLSAVTQYDGRSVRGLKKHSQRELSGVPLTKASVKARGKILDDYRQQVTQLVRRPLERILNGLSQEIPHAERRNLLKTLEKPQECYPHSGNDAEPKPLVGCLFYKKP
jgi:hypothetical protein